MTMRGCAVMMLFVTSTGLGQQYGQQTNQQANQQASQRANQQRRLRQQDQQPTKPRVSVGDLKNLCAAGDAAGKSACRYFVLGTSQGIGLGAGEAGGGSPVCIPGAIADDDVVATVKRAMEKYLAAFPDTLGKPAVSLVGAALMQAYPCGQ